tara:strand:+ start:420 stop:1712 length:1293 start_codon:yes stop_codon:yes gene_type:complete
LELLEKQEQAIYLLRDKRTTEILYGGAAGGGKSALGVLWIIEGCLNYKGSRWLMGRAVLKTLKETTLNTFFEISTLLDINDQWNYNQHKGTIQFDNGSEIILKDLFHYVGKDPNFDSLGSLEITGAFIDECNQVVYKAWQIVKSRIRYKLNEFDLTPKILGSCNPAKNWTYKFFYKPYKSKDLPIHRQFIAALPRDNPHLPESYIESLEQLDEVSRRRLLLGDWEYDDDLASLISYGAIMDYWNGNHLKEEGKTYLTIDVARKGKDKTVMRVWRGWTCVHRFEMGRSLLTEVVEQAQRLQGEYAITNSCTVADEDGVGGGVVDFLGCDGFINNSKAKYKENYDNLKSQCSIRMAKRIEERGIVERCKDTSIIELVSEEMEQVKAKDIDKDGKMGIVSKDKVKEQIGRSPDDWDSIMMREYFDLLGDFWIS